MSRRGGARGTESRRDQPSPAASRGGGAGRGSGRGRGGPVPSPAPSPASRSGPPPSHVATQPQPARTAPASPPSAPAAHASASSSAPPKVEALSGEMAKLSVQEEPPAPPPSSTKKVKLPARPGYGRAGTKCLVRANHFLVKIADTELCQYDVVITPEITSKKVNRTILSHLVKSFSASHLGGKKAAYDGMKSLYTAGELPFQSKEFAVKLPDDDEQRGSSSSSDSKSKKRDRDFKVVIKFASKPDIDHLMEFLRGRNSEVPQDTIQVLDIVLRHKPSEQYTVVGRSLFDHSLGDHGELGNGIEYWKGYYQSLRPTQMGLSLNIDVSARGFYEPIPVIKFVEKYLNLRGTKPWSDQERLKVRKVLRGIKVESHHLAHKKSYKVSGISMEPLSKLMFTLDDSGKQISVAQYFQQKYKIPIKYGFWPAIQAGSAAKPVSLPLEICSIVKGQRYTKKLNENQVRTLLRATCRRPNEREKSIKMMVEKNDYNRGEVVNQFGMNINAEMTTVDARVLPPPTILYHGTGRSATENPKMGAWNMINKKMINPGTVDYWGCVNFSTWGPDSPYMFCDDLIGMCISRGMIFQREPVVPICSDRPTNIQDVLKRVHKESLIKIAQKTGNKDKPTPLQLLIVILPEASGSFYGKIKRICETELGIVTQCCHPKKAEKGGQQYLENLSLKVNVKVGGRNSVLNDAVNRNLPIIGERPTIIFGADVTHPPAGEDSSPSIAAVVASMDWPEVTKYRGLVSAQGGRVEMIQELYTETKDPVKGVVAGGMIRDHLLAFYQKTRQKPDRILFYRDGVSEGQFNQVVLEEIDAIRKGCASLQKDYMPRVTFVVVQKRHHTRLFPVDGRATDRSGNVLPGTVVDTKICHPSEFDFYLNSHAGIQGTSRPAHYHVLYDENNFSADQLQMLTNSLCYTYARCTRSVSIVPPAYYAHLAAFRARYYMEDFYDLESTSGSAAAAAAAAGGPRPFHALPVIKENIKEVMFYC